MDPLLQIIHYTDMHLVTDGYARSRWMLRRALPFLPADHKQGWAGPRRAVLKDFENLVASLASEWREQQTWLVDTGDGTTFGDAASLDEWKEWSDKFLAAAGPKGSLVRVYGNHDGWPATFPGFAAGQVLMDKQRDLLRRDHFPAVWPEKPLTVQVPATMQNRHPSQIELYVVNTVDHERMRNSAALGLAARDWHWTRPPPIDTPACDLLDHARTQPGGANGKHLRVVAMHYPIADAATPGNPTWSKSLANRRRFARDLHAEVAPPVAHLVLAGHTHLAFPALGQLPDTALNAQHSPLGAGKCQIVSGSLSQELLSSTKPKAGISWADQQAFDFPQQCTVLRFYSQPNDPDEIVMDRVILGADDSGMFDYLPIAQGSQQTVETMTFRL
ncbi:hypothetical protein QTH97_26325 [Variovorax sp. J22R24]|uniref:hypothetical protein n=1 Tax=Variovorax gracilis TaxID=3053502 RepID=UPI0025756237|nr:hypothetical protein [Variovorax sp. J22R24]MDM0108492.1 hypothetical protein [Variovorax sp. J22R24]